MADKLDGSFSGLWTCELCGKTGTDCTCEHFERNGTVSLRSKTFSDAEIAAELWYQISIFQGWAGLANIFVEDEPELETQRERMYTVQRFADEKDYRED